MSLLESSINYLERSERYEIMSEIFKLLLPFYEKARDFKVSVYEGCWGLVLLACNCVLSKLTIVDVKVLLLKIMTSLPTAHDGHVWQAA